MHRKRLVSVTAALLVSAALMGPSALAQDAEEVDGGASDAATMELDVILQEFVIIPETTTLSAGSITINAENIGPNDPHELVIIKTDLPANALPTREDGGVDEDAEGLEVIGEIEEFEVGTTESATFDLAPGHYAFICNIVEQADDGTTEAHYQKGMFIDVEVT